MHSRLDKRVIYNIPSHSLIFSGKWKTTQTWSEPQNYKRSYLGMTDCLIDLGQELEGVHEGSIAVLSLVVSRTVWPRKPYWWWKPIQGFEWGKAGNAWSVVQLDSIICHSYVWGRIVKWHNCCIGYHSSTVSIMDSLRIDVENCRIWKWVWKWINTPYICFIVWYGC